MSEVLSAQFNGLITNGFIHAENVFEKIESDCVNQSAVYGHLSIANSFVNTSKAIYFCKGNELPFDEVENFHIFFDLFTSDVIEYLDNESDYEQLQTSYNKLESIYKCVMSQINIDII